MIEPLKSDAALVAEIEASASAGDPHRLDVWWLGQSGFLVAWNGHRLVFDPYLSDSLTRKYAGTDKPHVRLTRRAVDPGRLSGLDAATSSHNHTDHLDAETLGALAAANPGLHLVLPEANFEFARQRLGGASALRFVGLDARCSAAFGPWEFHGIPAAHNDLATDADGHHRYLGFVVRVGPFTLYHSGDTLWHDGLVEALLPFAPFDVVFVPINGNVPERRVAGNLNGTEAAALARAVNARLAVPHHFEMFEFNTASPAEFEAACARLGQSCRTLRCGERLVVAEAPGGS